MWYDVNETLSHNRLFNFVVGPRGAGKTYSCKRKVINNFIRKGEQFIYLRRYESEIRYNMISNFFADIAGEFNGTLLEVKRGGTFMIDEETAGWYMPLSKAAQYKSVAFPNVSLIIFDEFIIDRGMIRYLPNEVETFQEMYSTIARLRDVPCLFLSNAITYVNPYFLYYGLQVPRNATFFKRGDLLVHYVKVPDYTEAAKSTRFGNLIADKAYGQYAMSNEFLRDSFAFIRPMPEGSSAIALIKVEGQDLGVHRTRTGEIYISKKVDKTVRVKIALDNAGACEDYITSRNTEAGQYLMAITRAYLEGYLFFTDITAKNLIYRYLNFG